MDEQGMELQARKREWIPLCCRGLITEKQAAAHIGITPYSVSRLKKRYRLQGSEAFINGHTGKSLNSKFGKEVRALICSYYTTYWQGVNFAFYREILHDELNISISPVTLKGILNEKGIHSPKERGPRDKKVLHLPRSERACEGELIQLDASPYDWLMTGQTCSMHGAIDDATHKIVGLYITKNECRFGYSEVMRQILSRYGAPEAVYIDRHASLVKNARKKSRTEEERLEWSKKEATHWTEICKILGTEIILALSPEGKGRIERLWQTLQGRLPYIFRRNGITTIEEANRFLSSYINDFNARFSVPARNEHPAWGKIRRSKEEIDYLLQVRIEKSSRADGTFVFHGFTFHLDAPRAACRKFVLCLSEKDGVRASMGGSYYPVTLVDALTDCVGDAMPQVEKDLVAKYCLRNRHTHVYQFSTQ